MISPTWQFYQSSEAAWDGMYEACAAAKTSIDFEQFIFRNDGSGQRFVELFIRKAQEGVRVRLLLDCVGSFALYNDTALRKKMTDAGINLRFFNELHAKNILAFRYWFFRDHRKLGVIDREVGLIGGVGFEADFRDWRDTHVRIEGEEIVGEMQDAFDHMWWVSGREKFARFKEPRQVHGGFSIVTNAPHFRQRFVNRTFLDAIRNAREYVYLTTPYFVPDGRFFRVLRLAARRGVDVRLIVPKKCNHPYVDFASRSFFERAFKAGIRIYFYEKMVHAKTSVIDGEWSSVGSANIDNLSSFFNHEVNLVSVDRNFTEELRSHFMNDLKMSVEVSPETWHDRGFVQKLFEFLCAPLGRFF